MIIMNTFVQCPACGSTDMKEIEREPVKIGIHYTDQRITYRCEACKKDVMIG